MARRKQTHRGGIREIIVRDGKVIGSWPDGSATIMLHNGTVYYVDGFSAVNHGTEREYREKLAAGKIRGTLRVEAHDWNGDFGEPCPCDVCLNKRRSLNLEFLKSRLTTPEG